MQKIIANNSTKDFDIYAKSCQWMGSIMWILGGKNARFPKNTKMIQKIRKCAKY